MLFGTAADLLYSTCWVFGHRQKIARLLSAPVVHRRELLQNGVRGTQNQTFPADGEDVNTAYRIAPASRVISVLLVASLPRHKDSS